MTKRGLDSHWPEQVQGVNQHKKRQKKAAPNWVDPCQGAHQKSLASERASATPIEGGGERPLQA